MTNNVEFFQHPTDYNLNEYQSDPGSIEMMKREYGDDFEGFEKGFYYWYCFPGCLPDSEPIGPFETLEKAQEDFDNENWED